MHSSIFWAFIIHFKKWRQGQQKVTLCGFYLKSLVKAKIPAFAIVPLPKMYASINMLTNKTQKVINDHVQAVTRLYHFPAAPLNLYIDYFYYLEGLMPYPLERILPLPILDLKINLGGAFTVYEADSTHRPKTFTDSWWVGLYSKHHTLEWPSDMKFFGVRIKAGGAYPFLYQPLSALHNQIVPLDAIWNHFAAEIREKLAAAPTIQVGFTLLEAFLLARLRESPHGLDVVRYVLDQMTQCHGNLSIRALSDQIGISQNHLGTHFKQLVGITPKEMTRLIRFEHVLHTVDPEGPVNWGQVVHQCDYYDQSHFNKDFVRFTGQTPTEYLKRRHRVHFENAMHSPTLRNLPY